MAKPGRLDPVTCLLARWRNEADLLRRTGHPGARLRRVDIEELEAALRAFVNEPLPQTAVAEMLEKDASTIRRRTGSGGLRNVGTPNRPRYLRGEVQKLPVEWGLADGDLQELDEASEPAENTGPLPGADYPAQVPSRTQIARAIATGASDGR